MVGEIYGGARVLKPQRQDNQKGNDRASHQKARQMCAFLGMQVQPKFRHSRMVQNGPQSAHGPNIFWPILRWKWRSKLENGQSKWSLNELDS